MKYHVMTSFNQRYWDEVAKNSVLFLDKLWHKSGNIYLYHELPKVPQDPKLSDRCHWIDFYPTCPEVKEFAEKWKDNPMANGGGDGGNFKLNAIKFVHKTFAIWHRYKLLDSGWLVWADCDSFLLDNLDEKFIADVFRPNIVVSYVGRPGKYSECGFLAFNLNNPLTRDFLKEWETLYTSGEFVNLPETHDSWTFDYIRLKWNRPELFNDLNAGTTTNKAPFSNSRIGPYFAHAKGSDKVKTMNKISKRFKF